METPFSISEDINCPICYEIPKQEVFLCVNGHSICSTCLNKVSQCPQCSLPYGEVKIRNRVLESILDKLVLDCPYKARGCTTKLTRKHISNHIEDCSFGGKEIKFCQELGYSCQFVFNTGRMEEAYAHLQTAHNSKVVNMSKRRFRMLDITDDGTPLTSRRKTWSPDIVNLHGQTFLLFLIHNKQLGHVSMHSVITSGDGEQCSSKFRTEFRMKSEKPSDSPDLLWITTPVHIKHALATIRNPVFRLPQQLWRYYRSFDGKIAIDISIHNSNYSH